MDEDLEYIGREVEGSMDLETWFRGTLVSVEDIFAPYGILVHHLQEVRYFMAARLVEEPKDVHV